MNLDLQILNFFIKHRIVIWEITLSSLLNYILKSIYLISKDNIA